VTENPLNFEGVPGTASLTPVADAIRVIDLQKSFRGRRILNRISFGVRPGERVALLGPNGAGKTTTILTILGVVAPDSGAVFLRGYPVPEKRNLALEKVGFAAGYLALPDLMRVREALRVFADFYGVEDPNRRITEVVEYLGIGHLWNSFNGTLSAGQKTLVNLAKALLCRPEVLILDEPTASLDPDVARRTRRLLLDMWKAEKFAVLVTSHNMREVEELAQRVVFLYRGSVVADAPPGEVAARLGADNLEDAFVSLSETGYLLDLGAGAGGGEDVSGSEPRGPACAGEPSHTAGRGEPNHRAGRGEPQGTAIGSGAGPSESPGAEPV
jgi:ABC-2 type transport system ATP-binding protein